MICDRILLHCDVHSPQGYYDSCDVAAYQDYNGVQSPQYEPQVSNLANCTVTLNLVCLQNGPGT